MVQPQVIRGLWWLPDHEDEAVPGTLVLSADDFALNVMGSLNPISLKPSPRVYSTLFEWRDVPVVLGVSEDRHRPITLVDVGGTACLLPAGARNEAWYPDAAFLGAHLVEPEERLFDRCRLVVEDLPAWADRPRPGYQVAMSEEEGDAHAQSVTVSSTREHLGRARVNDADVRLVTAPSFDLQGSKLRLGVDAFFDVVGDTPMDWIGFLGKWISPLRSLVEFATTLPCASQDIYLHTTTAKTERRDGWVELLFRSSDLRRPDREATLSGQGTFLFTAASMKNGFGDGLERWLQLHDECQRALEPLRDVLEDPFPSQVDRFVAYAKAAEGLHAALYGSVPTAVQERDERVSRALASLPDDLVEWARPLLEHSTPPVARHRILALIGEAGPLANSLVADDPEGFAFRVVQTRNFLTHPTRGQKKAILTALDLHLHAEALIWLVRITFLGALGFSIDEVETMVRDTRGFLDAEHGMVQFVARIASEGPGDASPDYEATPSEPQR